MGLTSELLASSLNPDCIRIEIWHSHWYWRICWCSTNSIHLHQSDVRPKNRSESSNDIGWVFDTSLSWVCWVGKYFMVKGEKSSWPPWAKSAQRQWSLSLGMCLTFSCLKQCASAQGFLFILFVESFIYKVMAY
jgi:hypothetical protein